MTDARDKAFQITGLVRTSVTDLEILAADIQDEEVDRLVEVLRLATIQVGNRLTALRRERWRTNAG